MDWQKDEETSKILQQSAEKNLTAYEIIQE